MFTNLWEGTDAKREKITCIIIAKKNMFHTFD